MKLSFPLQMALATLLGIFMGLFFGEKASFFAPWGDAYIMILKITAIPYLAVAIVHGIGILNYGQAKQILKKGVLFIAIAISINIAMVYLIKWVFPATKGAHQMSYILRVVPPLDFAQLLIPDNIFSALSNNVIPAVVLFSLLIGIALMNLSEKQSAMSSLNTLLEALTRVTYWIARITPIGTFIIMANQMGTVQFNTIKQMATYIILYILGTSIVIFWIAPRLVSMLTNMKAYDWFKNLIPVLVLAYTTNLVIVSIPYIIAIVQREVQALYPKDENLKNQIQGTVSIIFNLPLGSIFITVFVFFLSVFYSIELNVNGQIELFLTTFLTSLGSVGLGAWINSLTFILDSLGLPIDGINFYLTTLPFTAGFQSMVSAMLISTLSFLITLACRGLLRIEWKRIIVNSALTFVPVLLIFGTLKYYPILPSIQNKTKPTNELEIQSNLSVRIYTQEQLPVPPITASPNEETLNRILRTKILRVGYDPNASPFAFYNNTNKLVGFDVAFAIELAYDLGANLEFIPLNYATIGQDLDNNLYDIGMSAISITEERLKQMCFTTPYLDGRIVFITKAPKRSHLSNLDFVKSDEKLEIAVLKGSSYENLARQEFSGKKLILLDKEEDFIQLHPYSILIWEEQEALAWAATHPGYHVILPNPQVGKDALSYPIKYGAHDFKCYMDNWLKLKQDEGFTEKQYNLWILGKTEEVLPYQPRWSILREVLHLAD